MMDKAKEFEDALQRLVSHALPVARKNDAMAATMFESQITALALTIATISDGDVTAINKMLMGAESYLAQGVTKFVRTNQMIGK